MINSCCIKIGVYNNIVAEIFMKVTIVVKDKSDRLIAGSLRKML